MNLVLIFDFKISNRKNKTMRAIGKSSCVAKSAPLVYFTVSSATLMSNLQLNIIYAPLLLNSRNFNSEKLIVFINFYCFFRGGSSGGSSGSCSSGGQCVNNAQMILIKSIPRRAQKVEIVYKVVNRMKENMNELAKKILNINFTTDIKDIYENLENLEDQGVKNILTEYFKKQGLIARDEMSQ